MKIIDAHMHFSDIGAFAECAEHRSLVDYTESGWTTEAEASEIVCSVCMGLTESVPGAFPDADARTPMTADLAENIPQNMLICIGINPHTTDNRSLCETEELIAQKNSVAGLKIYAGYYRFPPADPVYDPVYRLAEKYNIPVVIHTGETFSERGLLKYAHPLLVDELAVARPDLKIVVCHMGAPWVFDACETAGKNKNVYVDISGLLVGSAAYVAAMSNERLILDRYAQPLVMMDNYYKVIFGTDWPLAPVAAYIDFCRKIIPPDSYEYVFYKNAAALYRVE